MFLKHKMIRLPGYQKIWCPDEYSNSLYPSDAIWRRCFWSTWFTCNDLLPDGTQAIIPSQWRLYERDGVSNHQRHDCLLNGLFRRRSKKTSKLRVIGLWAGNSPVTGEFPAQMASNEENVSIWWRHHDCVNRCGLIINEVLWHSFNVMFTWFVSIDVTHKSPNAPVPYRTMLHPEQKYVHYSSEWSIVGYGTGAFWDLWNWFIPKLCLGFIHLKS